MDNKFARHNSFSVCHYFHIATLVHLPLVGHPYHPTSTNTPLYPSSHIRFSPEWRFAIYSLFFNDVMWRQTATHICVSSATITQTNTHTHRNTQTNERAHHFVMGASPEDTNVYAEHFASRAYILNEVYVCICSLRTIKYVCTLVVCGYRTQHTNWYSCTYAEQHTRHKRATGDVDQRHVWGVICLAQCREDFIVWNPRTDGANAPSLSSSSKRQTFCLQSFLMHI